MMDSSRKAAKGLVTVALLKSYFDAGHDHIGMFMPFLLDVIKSRPQDDFSLMEIKAELTVKHGLEVPAEALKTLLGRASRDKAVKREGGRYFRKTDALTNVDIDKEREQIQREHSTLALAMREYATSQGVNLETEEDALALLLGFLEQRQVALLLDEPRGDNTSSTGALSRRELRIVARFIEGACKTDTKLAGYLRRMLEGFVLQNALLLKDISTAARKFIHLEVYFDTGFLLRALGFEGEANRLAARETLEMLQLTHARLAVFDKTLDEVKRILHVYERHLGSTEGRKSLYPTQVTRHFLTKRYSPSDVREAAALLERNVRDLGISIRTIPEHDRRYTLDERDLSKRLMRGDESELEPRVVHDVDCIAGVLTLRRGRSRESLDDAVAVFATTHGSVVRTVGQWHKESGGTGVAPIVHQVTLSNIAWLKKPASGVRLKLHELVALCAAALRPSKKVWDSFLRHLRKLEASGALSSEEAVAVVVSELTDSMLMEVDEGTDVDADTLTEVIDRVKATYKAEADAAVARANASAAEEGTARRQMVSRVEGRAHQIGRVTSRVILWIAGALIIVGLIVMLPGVLSRFGGVALVLGWISALMLSGLTVVNLVRGVHLEQWRVATEVRIARTLRAWFLGEE